MTTTTSATPLQKLRISDVVASTHGWPAIHPNGDAAVAYTTGPDPQTVKVTILKPVETATDGKPLYTISQRITIATPTGAATPSAVGPYSCVHPSICPIEDGFALFWERKDSGVAQTAMTAGGLQIEMAKIVPDGSQYVTKQSATAGKGFVLDNTVIAGHSGGVPRCHWSGRGNVVGVVYGHQQTYSNVADDVQRTWSVRAAYLDFTPNGKPTFVSGGNRTGGSAVGEATDGGYAAGPTQTYLVQNIDLDADAAVSDPFASGGGLPHCIFDHRSDFTVAYEARNGKAGTGGIVVRAFKGPASGSGLDEAAIWSDTTSFGATAGDAARRPWLACRNAIEESVGLTGGTFDYPPYLLVYGSVDPAGGIVDTALAFTITLHDGAVPTVAALTIPPNANYDATVDPQALPCAVDSSFLSAVVVQELIGATAAVAGNKFKIKHADSALDPDVILPSGCRRPQRPNMQARKLRNRMNIAALTYEGQDAAGSGNEHVYIEFWLFP